jgi:membrane associated rhomboid family serine protease
MIFPIRDDVIARSQPVATYTLLALNTAMMIFVSLASPERQQVVALRYGFIPARLSQLTNPRPLAVDFDVEVHNAQFPQGAVVRHRVELQPERTQILATLITAMFLHGGWWHLLGNMWFLWLFGDNVEDRLGHAKFLVLYLAGGVLASLCHAWWQPPGGGMTPVIGASGAVAAVLGAYAITWPNAKIHTFVVLIIFVTIFELPAMVVLGVWFVTQLLEASTAAHPGVAWWAHVGGFVAGMALMRLMTIGAPPPQPHGDHFKEQWEARHRRHSLPQRSQWASERRE